jgi:hypothetical protein
MPTNSVNIDSYGLFFLLVYPALKLLYFFAASNPFLNIDVGKKIIG